MIGYVIFENEDGAFYNPRDFGIHLKSCITPPPKPKIFRESIDGMDGELDFTEYAGEVRYNSREVNISFTDMAGVEYERLVNFISGQKIKILYNYIPDYYFYGRCESIDLDRHSPIVELKCRFACFPYMQKRIVTKIQETVSTSKTIKLQSLQMSVVPTITVTAAMTLGFDGKTVALEAAGTYTNPEIVITKAAKNMAVTGSGTIEIVWRDGVI